MFFDPNTNTNCHGKYLSCQTIQKHQLQDHKTSAMEKFKINNSTVTESSVVSSSSSNYSVFEGSNTMEKRFLMSEFFLAVFPEMKTLTPTAVSIIVFIHWLHLLCGISRENCKKATTLLFKILKESKKNMPQFINSAKYLATLVLWSSKPTLSQLSQRLFAVAHASIYMKLKTHPTTAHTSLFQTGIPVVKNSSNTSTPTMEPKTSVNFLQERQLENSSLK